MRWKRGQQSRYVDDRRGRRGGAVAVGGAGGVVALVVVVLVSLLGGGGGGGTEIPGLGDILSQLGGAPAAPAGGDSGITEGVGGTADDELEDFMRFVMNDVQAVWDGIFATAGRTYEPTTLVLFEGGVTTGGCGSASAAVGPFYCPADSTAYIDLSFFRDLATRFGAPGDFAQAYVIAHEVGHHVQNLLGTSAEVARRERDDPDGANELSVRQELQADCYAGVWAHATFEAGVLEDGEVAEGLDAARAIGDDTLQEQAGIDVNPETWTHGSSALRAEWFTRGFDSGDPRDCDTFSADIDLAG